VIVIDEYLAVRVIRAHWPDRLPDDELGLPASRHWRPLQALHGGRGGQLSRLFAGASPAVVNAIRWPHPDLLTVLDPRPLLDEAAMLAARFGGTGLIVARPSPPDSHTAVSCGLALPPTSVGYSSAQQANSASPSRWRPPPEQGSGFSGPRETSRHLDRPRLIRHTNQPLVPNQLQNPATQQHDADHLTHPQLTIPF